MISREKRRVKSGQHSNSSRSPSTTRKVGRVHTMHASADKYPSCYLPTYNWRRKIDWHLACFLREARRTACRSQEKKTNRLAYVQTHEETEREKDEGRGPYTCRSVSTRVSLCLHPSSCVSTSWHTPPVFLSFSGDLFLAVQGIQKCSRHRGSRARNTERAKAPSFLLLVSWRREKKRNFSFMCKKRNRRQKKCPFFTPICRQGACIPICM